jgi:BlaI family penicillinase repressor
MSERSIDNLGDLQRAVLETVWRHENATVQDVLDDLAPERKLAYTTVLTTLQNLERDRWVTHTRRGRAYVYAATRSKRRAGAQLLRSLIERVFDGDSTLLMESLLEEETLSAEEVEQLRKLITQRKRRTRE